MPSSTRHLRSVGALTVSPVTTPVAWGTAANPANMPLPRGAEEWDRACRPCTDADAIRVQAAVARYGPDVVESFGEGFVSGADLSDYSAWMALGMIDMHRMVADAIDRAAKDTAVIVAGAHYRAHPVAACAGCGHDTPHTSGEVVMCLVCGERP